MNRYLQLTVLVGIFILSFPCITIAQEFRLPRVAPGDVISADLTNEIYESLEIAIQRVTDMNQLVGQWRCTKYVGTSSLGVSVEQSGPFAYHTIDLNIVNDGDGTYSWDSSPYVAWVSPQGRGVCGGTCDQGRGDIALQNGYLGVTLAENPCNSACDRSEKKALYSITRRSLTSIDFHKAAGTDHDHVLACAKQNLPPASPNNLAVTAAGLEVALSWTDNSSDETGFKILRKSRLQDALAEVASVGANIVSFGDTVTPGTYWYRVVATNANGDSSGSNVIRVTVEEPAAGP